MGWPKNRAEQAQEAAARDTDRLIDENAQNGGSTTSSEAAQQTPAASRWGILSGGGSKLVELDGDRAPEGIAEQGVVGGGIHFVLAEYAMKGVAAGEAVQSTGQPGPQEF